MSVEAEPNEQPQSLPSSPPARELAQTSIASFLYGTLQLLATSIGAALVFGLAQVVAAFTAATSAANPANPRTPQGTDITDLAGMQDLLKSLSNDPNAPVSMTVTPPDVSTGIPGMPDLSGLMPTFTPGVITPFDILIVLGTSTFGLLSILTAFITFAATSKGRKTGRGLAVSGVISSILSLGIAFVVAYLV